MKLLKYFALVLAQLAGMLALGYIGCNLLWLSDALHAVCWWALTPAMGLISAYMITVRGVNNYAAWIAPPLAMVGAHYLAFFYLPASPGAIFICALASVVGAAAGDVSKKLKHK